MSNLSFATPGALLGWLKQLAADRRVVAPRQEGPTVMFREQGNESLEALADIHPLLRRATASPKEAILPRCEALVRFKSTKDSDNPAHLQMTLEAPCEAAPTVLFGGRPCDARGFVALDRPYLQGKFVDPYYQARRDATVIITQACPHAYAGCFCNWVGSNPHDGQGSDILFTEVDGGFVLQALSDKGRALLEQSGFEDGSGRAEAVAAAHAAADATLPPPSDLGQIPARVAARFTDEAFWDKETVKCLGCGACTYLCPTCQCFTITDEGSALDGVRMRSWDSCMTAQFTLEASGHNPRGDKGKRMRQRISHKFSYYPSAYEGEYSCCGCGRCVVSCPVSLDIRQVVRRAVEGAPQGVVDPAPAAAPVAAAAPELGVSQEAAETASKRGKGGKSKKSSKKIGGKE